MSFSNWLRKLISGIALRRSPIHRTHPARFTPRFDTLEDRLTPAFNLTIGSAATIGVLHDAAGDFTASTTGANINVADIQADLAAGKNVTISNGGDSGGEVGTITWLAGSDLDYNGIGTGRTLSIVADPTTQVSAQLVLNSRILDVNLRTPDALNVNLEAQHDLVVNAGIFAGSGTILLQADAAGSGTGTLHLASGTTVSSTDSGPSGITLRGADLDIQGSVNANAPRVWAAGLNAATFDAVDAQGHLYVANQSTGTVSEYAADGTLVNAAFASGLSSPQGLAFDAHGNLYVATANGTVSAFSSRGTLLNARFVSGLAGVRGVAFDGQGNFYVANYNYNYGGQVSKYTASGALLNSAFVSGLPQPTGLAFDQAGNLYVAQDYYGGDRVSAFSATGAPVNYGFATGLSSPQGLAFDTQGNLYVVNQGNNTVSQITPQGAKTTFAAAGLSSPSGVAFGQGNLYVVNQGNNTVSKVAADGTVSTLVQAALATPTYEAFGKDGNLYVANSGNGTVSEFAPDGTLLKPAFVSGLAQVAGLAFDQSGNLYVANVDVNGKNDQVSKYDPSGQLLNRNFALLAASNNPAGLAFGKDGNLYLADRGNGTVSAFAADGSLRSASFVTGLASPAGLAFDAAGNLFVGSSAWYASISEFSPGGAPLHTGLAHGYSPAGLAFDQSGNLYVARLDGGVVSDYSPSGVERNYSYGSGLSGPQGLAFDGHGNLYVTNRDNNTISLVPAVGGTVVVRSSVASRPINVSDGGNTAAGVNLTQLYQLNTGPTGTVVVGDPSQTGDITFSVEATVASSGATLVALQDTAGPGRIVLNNGLPNAERTALYSDYGNISLTAGTGGITSVGASSDSEAMYIGGSGALLLASGGNVGSAATPLFVRLPNLGASTIAGNLYLSDSQSLTTTGGAHAGGALNFTQSNGSFTTQQGDLSAAASNLNFTSGGEQQQLNSGGQALTSVTHTGNAILALGDDLALTGSFTNLDGAGNVDITGRTVHAGGDWSWGNSGKLVSDFSTVVLDGTGQAIRGNSSFYNLTKATAVPDTLMFQAGSTQNVAGVLTLQGAYGNPLRLRSSGPGTRWLINPQGYRAVSNVDVADSFNNNAYPLVAASSTNSGNNLNWTFPPNILALLQAPPTTDTAVAGQTLPAFQVAIEDANGNVLTQANGPVAVSLLGGAFAAGTTTQPAVNGIATFTGLIDDSAGADTLQVADPADGLAPITTPIRIDVGAPAAVDVVAGAAQSVPVDTAYSALKVQVTDAYGNPVGNSRVTFAAPGTGATGAFAGNPTVTTNAQGVAVAPVFTAGHASGSFTVTASVAGVADPAVFYLTNTAGAAASLQVAGGDAQRTAVGTGFGTLLQARVVDADGNPVAGAPVTFTVPAGGASGTFDALATVSTDALGIATAPALTANRLVGSYVVTASTPGVAGTATFHLTNTPAPAFVSTVSGWLQTTGVTQAFHVALQARVVDAFGRPLSGITVTFTAPDSGPSATFAGGASAVTASTDARGIATAPVLTANTVAGSFDVPASVAGLARSATFTLTNRPGSAAAFGVVTHATQSAVVTTSYAQRLQVQVIDAYGNPLAGVWVNFAAPATGSFGTFTGGWRHSWVLTAANGVATAPVFTAGTQAGSFTIAATVAGVGTPATFDRTNLPGRPYGLRATAGARQATTPDTAFDAALALRVTDYYGNPIPGVMVSYTVRPNATTGAAATFATGPANTASVMTDALGVAVSPLLTANSKHGTFTVRATVNGAPGVAVFTLTIR